MNVYKKKQLKTMQIEFKTGQPSYTIIAYGLNVFAILIMVYFGVRHLVDEPSWAKSAFMQLGFGTIGLLGIQLISEQQIILTNPGQFRKINLNTGIRACVIALLGAGIQIISNVALSFTILEQAVYFVFSAITEEVFFRGFLMTLIIRMDPSKQKFTLIKLGGVLVQALAFTFIHQNYYGNLGMLISVFFGGLMLGLVYLVWEDLTANILGHFIINIIAVQNLLVML